MNYSEKFKNYLLITLKGIAVGLLISIVLSFILFRPDKYGFDSFVLYILFLFVPISLIASIIFAYKDGDNYILGDMLSKVIDGIKNLFFGSALSANTTYIGAILLIVGIIKIVIGLIVFSVVALFAGVTYVLNFVYCFIMCILEKCHVLDGKERLCEILDKLVLVLSIVCVVGIIYMGYKYYIKTY